MKTPKTLLALLLITSLPACGSSDPAADEGTDASGSVGETNGDDTSSGSGETGSEAGSTETSGDGDGDSTAGDGDGDSATGDGDGDGDCDLFAQDCSADGNSCYPTQDGGECLPTGQGGTSTEFLEQCAVNNDCTEGFFCNPENFNHCVPFCMVGTDCETGEPCNEVGSPEFSGLPAGVGYCYPWPPAP
jgi:hypothetical protein